MQVLLDGNALDFPQAATLGELMEGIAPWLDPARLVTRVEVDGALVDATDRQAMQRWRLRGDEAVAVGTEPPAEFAQARRQEIAGHLRRIAQLVEAAARGLAAGEGADGNRLLAAATRELGLVLVLDRRLAVLDPGQERCEGVARTVRRIGPHLEEAERGRRWQEVAELLSEELLPVLRAGAA